jgi:hypothetical protein
VVGEEGDPATSMTFFDEALRLRSPPSPRPATTEATPGWCWAISDGALDDCQTGDVRGDGRGRAADDAAGPVDHPHRRGDVGEGWDDYEARLAPTVCRRHPFHDRRAPCWTPDSDLTGKALLLMGEQGLGDEVMFANRDTRS